MNIAYCQLSEKKLETWLISVIKPGQETGLVLGTEKLRLQIEDLMGFTH